jgi:hypothetical protein
MADVKFKLKIKDAPENVLKRSVSPTLSKIGQMVNSAGSGMKKKKLKLKVG